MKLNVKSFPEVKTLLTFSLPSRIKRYFKTYKSLIRPTKTHVTLSMFDYYSLEGLILLDFGVLGVYRLPWDGGRHLNSAVKIDFLFTNKPAEHHK